MFDNTIILPKELVDSIDMIIKYQNKQLEKEINKIVINDNIISFQICLPTVFWIPEPILEPPSGHFPQKLSFSRNN